MNRPARTRHRWMTMAAAAGVAVLLWLAWNSHRPRAVMDELPAELGVKP